ncbi:MAG: SGNH/GDSL hydrolase family protein [Gammaproteobacteria bacterium]|nr:SGNH/GDSL hydrolase family protein [Gammaproteobacteria bacterium]
MRLKRQYSLLWVLGLFCSSMLGAYSASAQPPPFDSIVVFGASLSDSGNDFVVLSNPEQFGFEPGCDLTTPSNVPPYANLDDLFIPSASYSRGGHHFTNGATWVESLASATGLSGTLRPALRNEGEKAQNYAVGGARAVDLPCRFNLMDQLGAYLSSGHRVSDETLFIFDIGSNDLRDALADLPNDPAPILTAALSNISDAIQTLYAVGGRQFLIANAPDFGQTPAVQILDGSVAPGAAFAARQLALGFNDGLTGLQLGLSALPAIDIRSLDLFALFNEILAEPEDFGISETEMPCITPNIPPYVCKKPNQFLFWDGIHPSKAVHKVMADEARKVLFAPNEN